MRARGISGEPVVGPPATTPKVVPVPPGATTAGTLVPKAVPVDKSARLWWDPVGAPPTPTDTRPGTGMGLVMLLALVPVGYTTSLSARATHVTLPVLIF